MEFTVIISWSHDLRRLEKLFHSKYRHKSFQDSNNGFFGCLVFKRIMYDFPAWVQVTVRARDFCFPSLFPVSFLVAPTPVLYVSVPLSSADLCSSPWWGDSRRPTLAKLHKAHKHLWGGDLTIKGLTREHFFLDFFRQSAKVHPPLPPDTVSKSNFRFKGCQWMFSFSLTCCPCPLRQILNALSHVSHNSNPSMFAGTVSAIWELPGGSGHRDPASPAVKCCSVLSGAVGR